MNPVHTPIRTNGAQAPESVPPVAVGSPRPTSARPPVRLSENQRKVITDKYLRNDPSPEVWLDRVAANIALAELLHAPEADGWHLWDGVKRRVIDVATRKTHKSRLNLLHHGIVQSDERDKNFAVFLGNLRRAVAEVPEARALMEEWRDRFYGMMARFDFLPNSPTLMNAGRELQQLSACYVLPVPDSMEGIADALKAQALIHKSGGGTGFSFQRVRPSGDSVKSTKGTASGAISFMQIFDKMTDVVKQGGTRRGANMGILPYWHPEIEDFINMKTKPGVMENFNVSVTVDGKFMEAAQKGEEYDLLNPRTLQPTGKRVNARDVFEKMVDGAWKSGDPGIIFIDRINNSPSNPTPHLGQIESTNPCFAGGMRLVTDRGLLTFEELHIDQSAIGVATDDRAASIRLSHSVSAHGGGTDTLVTESVRAGVTVRSAVPVFKTRRQWPVFALETRQGFRVVATDDHKFFTPRGLVPMKDLKPGDDVLIQSGRGLWSTRYELPPFLPEDKLAARLARGECRLPKRWSEELGQLLGWVIGDGWVSQETPAHRTVPNFTVGMTFGGEEKKTLAPRFQALIQEWLGLKGSAVERNGVLSLSFKSSLYYFLRSLGLSDKEGLNKEVPESLWRAPREAVIGFLRALFTADGTVNRSFVKGACSVRLANSSKTLLQQVQLMLLNENIVAKLYLRRSGSRRWMPDSQRRPKLYDCAPQYELVIDGESRDRFLAEIGFLLGSKQQKAMAWLAAKKRRSNAESFVDSVASIVPAGTEDVYCTTEPETHSLIANGFVAANCGEQPLLPNEPCNLGSINLANFVDGEVGHGKMNWDRLGKTVALAVRFLDDVIEVNNYPLPQIEELSKGNRRIGLGVMGWAEALVKMGVPYDSDESLKAAGEVMGFVNTKAMESSELLAEERGVFPNWKGSIFDKDSPHFRGEEHLPRHCARTTIAPTGTIGLAAGLQGAGIEPFFAITYTRYNAKALAALKKGEKPAEGDVFYEVNPLFREVARRNNYFGLSETELWKKVEANHKSVRGIKEIPEAVQKLFATSHDVPVPFHVQIQAAFQTHTDNAVSKTINMPHTATREDVKNAYRQSYEMGCKGITIYRDGSKSQQVLNLGAGNAAAEKPKARDASRGMSSEYYEIRTGHGGLHVHIDYDETGPYRLFTSLSPLGTDISGLTSVVGIMISKYLEAGGDPKRILKHLNSVKGDRPFGFGAQRVDSIPHAIAIALRTHLQKHGKMDAPAPAAAETKSGGLELWDRSAALYCPDCFSANVAQQSGCTGVTCFDCGHSECS
jgi:ribonucleoside-diphosphate reductase alpha chain